MPVCMRLPNGQIEGRCVTPSGGIATEYRMRGGLNSPAVQEWLVEEIFGLSATEYLGALRTRRFIFNSAGQIIDTVKGAVAHFKLPRFWEEPGTEWVRPSEGAPIEPPAATSEASPGMYA
jgi:hypothetical protein